MLARTFGAFVALSLSAAAVVPAAAAPAPVPVRAGAPADEANALTGTTLYIVGAIVLGLAVWGIIELLDDDDEAFPVSP